jgi:hypothetical protein
MSHVTILCAIQVYQFFAMCQGIMNNHVHQSSAHRYRIELNDQLQIQEVGFSSPSTHLSLHALFQCLHSKLLLSYIILDWSTKFGRAKTTARVLHWACAPAFDMARRQNTGAYRNTDKPRICELQITKARVTRGPCTKLAVLPAANST